jgi:hypothetical protein
MLLGRAKKDIHRMSVALGAMKLKGRQRKRLHMTRLRKVLPSTG